MMFKGRVMNNKKRKTKRKRKMVDKWHIYLLGLISIFYLTGTSGVKETHVFSSDGVKVTLPCSNAQPDCRSTHWFYNKEKESVVELFAEEIKMIEHERLSLGSDCSLNIYKTTKEDIGGYICRQQMFRTDPNTDVYVYLHFLHVSSSSTQTEIKPGSSVTLYCQLYLFYGYDCESLLDEDRFQMIWVNESDVNLQSDRYQISSSLKHCNSSLTTTLLNEDNNREWRCQIIKGTEVKTSVRYTVKYLAEQTESDVLHTVIPAVSAVVVSLLALLLLWLICNKRAGKRKMPEDSHEESYERTNPAVCETNISFNPPPVHANEETEDVAYAEINHKKGFTERHNVQCDDIVTYSAIRGGTVGHQAV